MLIYCSVAVVTTSRNTVLVLRRQKGRDVGLWECPGGHVDPGEDAVDGLLRELKEEAGIDGINRDQCRLFGTMYDDAGDGTNKNVVSCFHVALTSVEPEVTLEHIFDDAVWYNLRNPQPEVTLTKDCSRLIALYDKVIMQEDVVTGE